MKDILKQAKKEKEIQERQNIAEINDYMKNYSSMSFDDYKKIKNKKNRNDDNK